MPLLCLAIAGKAGFLKCRRTRWVRTWARRVRGNAQRRLRSTGLELATRRACPSYRAKVYVGRGINGLGKKEGAPLEAKRYACLNANPCKSGSGYGLAQAEPVGLGSMDSDPMGGDPMTRIPRTRIPSTWRPRSVARPEGHSAMNTAGRRLTADRRPLTADRQPLTLTDNR